MGISTIRKEVLNKLLAFIKAPICSLLQKSTNLKSHSDFSSQWSSHSIISVFQFLWQLTISPRITILRSCSISRTSINTVLYSTYPGRGGEEKKTWKGTTACSVEFLTRQITFLYIWSVALTLIFFTLWSVLTSPGSFPFVFLFPAYIRLPPQALLTLLPPVSPLPTLLEYHWLHALARIVSWILHTVQMCMSDVQSSKVNATVDRNCGGNITNQSQENCCVF